MSKTMNFTEKERILSFLDQKKIPYVSFSHPKTDTLPEKLSNDAAAGVFGATHCKNLVLCNRQKTKFFLLTMPFGKRFRTGPVSRQMTSSRLSFAEDKILEEILCTHSGMVSPLELIFDTEKKISFFMDKELLSAERICFHPSDDTCTVVMENRDFFEGFLKEAGIKVGFVDANFDLGE